MKVRVVDSMMDLSVRIYLEDDQFIYGKSREGDEMRFEKNSGQQPSEDFQPYMRMTQYVWEEFMKGIVDIADRKGIRPDSNSKLEGELEATKKHLESMEKVFATTFNADIQTKAELIELLKKRK